MQRWFVQQVCRRRALIDDSQSEVMDEPCLHVQGHGTIEGTRKRRKEERDRTREQRVYVQVHVTQEFLWI